MPCTTFKVQNWAGIRVPNDKDIHYEQLFKSFARPVILSDETMGDKLICISLIETNKILLKLYLNYWFKSLDTY